MKINNSDLIVVVLFFILIGAIIYAAITKNAPKQEKVEVKQPEQASLLNTENEQKSAPETNVQEPSQPEVVSESTKTQANPSSAISELVKKSMTTNDKLLTKKPEKSYLESGKTYTAILNTTAGIIKIKLNADKVPNTVNNFVYLSKIGFYDNVIFHRVIKDFMIQSGDPVGDGTGGPAYRFDDEKFDGEYKKGIVAMANAGPNTNGSQFFIMHGDVAIQKAYVIFGEVTDGMDVVNKIATAEVLSSASGEKSSPKSPVVVNTVDIVVE